MKIPALLLLPFVLLSSDAFGRVAEGESDRRATREEAGETASSEYAGEVLTPWEPSSRPLERRKRQLWIQSRNQEYNLRGARVPIFPGAPPLASVPAPPSAPPSPRPLHLTRLVPVFMSSDFVGATGGVNGPYAPPITEPPTGIPIGVPEIADPTAGTPVALPPGVTGLDPSMIMDIEAAPRPAILTSLPCPGTCEVRSETGDCDLDAVCLFRLGL
nr:SH3 domain-containing protein C23A1.17-like [Penaeus vannamei]